MAIGSSGVGCELRFDVAERATLALQVAVATTVRTSSERLAVDCDGEPLPIHAVPLDHGGRAHLVTSGRGTLTVRYEASVEAGDGGLLPAFDGDRLRYLRQSRYCPSDLLESFVEAELPNLRYDPDAATVVARWVNERLDYELGSSRPQDTALDTLLAGRGVCRDFAHLTVALCRASGIAARLVAVYAPFLEPMDFHAVAEVAGPGGWQVVDPTRLAPRPTLVRIATGRDVADTAFAVTLDGSAELESSSVWATSPDQPLDDHSGPVAVA